MRSLNHFYEGLQSMGPVGLWLPWSEVVQLAGRCGWSGEDCGVAANIWCGLQAVELDPCDGDERPAGPSQYRRVRLLPMHATDGVLDVSDSSDVEASAESPQPEPVLPPLDERPCVDAAPVDVKDTRLLPLFFSMWTQHHSELLAGLDGGLRLDIPEWASELFRDGRGWTPEAAAGSAGKKPARWGRCSYPSCSGRAFRPVLGARGPFLLCSRRGCPGAGVLRWNTEFGWLVGLGEESHSWGRLHAMSMRRNGATCFTMPRNGMPAAEVIRFHLQ